MLDTREKLIELLMDKPLGGSTYEKEERHSEDVADYLIANGVTVTDTNVGKWIPVSERLPEEGEIVLACGKRHATSGMFQGASRNDPKWWHWKGNTLKEVTHWMPLPEPPKGE